MGLVEETQKSPPPWRVGEREDRVLGGVGVRRSLRASGGQGGPSRKDTCTSLRSAETDQNLAPQRVAPGRAAWVAGSRLLPGPLDITLPCTKRSRTVVCARKHGVHRGACPLAAVTRTHGGRKTCVRERYNPAKKPEGQAGPELNNAGLPVAHPARTTLPSSARAVLFAARPPSETRRGWLASWFGALRDCDPVFLQPLEFISSYFMTTEALNSL